MLLIGIAGPSESGKSHAAAHLCDTRSTVRLKLARVMRAIFDVRQVVRGEEWFDEWPFGIERENPRWLRDCLVEYLAGYAPDTIVTIESLYGSVMWGILRAATPGASALWYIEAPAAMRVDRQQGTAAVANLDEVALHIARRDRMKCARGLADLERAADVLIDNNGDLVAFHRRFEDALDAARFEADSR